MFIYFRYSHFFASIASRVSNAFGIPLPILPDLFKVKNSVSHYLLCDLITKTICLLADIRCFYVYDHCNSYDHNNSLGVLASDGWWEAWQPSQGNQEPLVVKDKVEDPSVSLGSASPWNVILLPSMLWHCWLSNRKGIRPVKSWVGLLVVMIWLEHCTTYSSSCHHHLHQPLLQ